jgi:hypothetical protein
MKIIEIVIPAVCISGIVFAPAAYADPSTPPTPSIGTGGNVSGSQQGSSCQPRPAWKSTTGQVEDPRGWTASIGDWPGLTTVPPIAAPTTAPVPGCSR